MAHALLYYVAENMNETVWVYMLHANQKCKILATLTDS